MGILALETGQLISRDQLSALLWSDADQTTARASLRQALRRLKRGLGALADEVLLVDQHRLGLEIGEGAVDLHEAFRAAEGGRAPDLVKKCPEACLQMMDGLDYVDPAFASWLAMRRQRLHQDMLDLLGEALRGHAEDPQRGVEIAQALYRMEPTHEAAVRYLIRQHQATGETAAALALYNELWQTLETQYDVLPSEETQRLVVEIKMVEARANSAPKDACEDLVPAPERPDQRPGGGLGEAMPAPWTRCDQAPRLPVVQIADFAIEGRDEHGAQMTRGLRVDFLSSLCRFREWQVMEVGEDAAPVRDAGPGEVFRLDASCLDRPDGAEVIVRFSDAATRHVIWSERLPATGEGLAGLQRRAVRRIALAMNLHLAANRLDSLPKLGDDNLSAHDAWLIGQALMTDWRPESEDRAEALFRRLVASHPRFAPAHTGLAQVLNARHHIRPGIFRSRSIHREALALSNRAVSLDPLDAKAQLVLAWSLALNGEWDAAIPTFRIAVELNENDAWTLVSSALGLAYCGDHASASELSLHVVQLGLGVTPLHWAYHAGVRFMEGDYEGAAHAAELGEDATPYIKSWHAAALGHLGRDSDAREVLQRFYRETRAGWVAVEQPSEAAMNRWLLHCYPIRGETAWRRLRDGLASAGGHVPAAYPAVPS